MKNKANTLKESLEEKNRQMEKKLLHPIFEVDLESADFSMTKLIRVTDIDKNELKVKYVKVQSDIYLT